MPEIYKKIHPSEITQFPVLVMEHDEQSAAGGAINVLSHGNWNHVMWLISPTEFATQDPIGFHVVPVAKYINNPAKRLKFYAINDPFRREALMREIRRKLALPWYKRRYDFLGILGQALHIPWLQMPWGAQYCSEEAASDLNKCCGMILDPQSTPSQIDRCMAQYPYIQLLGYWFED